jgi:hypothetical protein
MDQFFAFGLSNTRLIISFARENTLLHKMHLYHISHYCRSNTEVDISRINKVLESPVHISISLAFKSPKLSKMQLTWIRRMEITYEKKLSRQ